MPSTVPTVVSELVALLEADTDLTGVLVRYGAPLVVPDDNERIYVLDAANYQRNRGEQDLVYESFRLRLIVEVYREGDTPYDALSRKWELIEVVDGILARERFYGYDTEGGDFTEEPALFASDGGMVSSSNLLIPVGERG